MEEGQIVISIRTGQSGTVVKNETDDLWVLLRNGDILVELSNMFRFPQGEEDLNSCPIDVERLESRSIVKKKY
jgi:hypothetical protein